MVFTPFDRPALLFLELENIATLWINLQDV